MPGDDRLEGKPPPTKPRPRARTTTKSKSTTKKAASSAISATLPQPEAPPTQPRLKERYVKEVIPTMMQEFGYHTPMEVPQLKKVVLNVGLGEALTNARAIESTSKDLATISGQKPIVTRAKKSIAGFKLRQDVPIGVCVTLRGNHMLYFLDRLFNAALPRIRDFRGVSRNSFDGRGNYSLGIREQIIFPEIEYGEIERIRGFQVTIATTAKSDREGRRLLELLGVPFARQS